MDIRPLTVNDSFAVIKMLLKVTGNARKDISSVLSESGKKVKKCKAEKADSDAIQAIYTDAGIRLTISVLNCLMLHAEVDLKAWLGSLIGKTAKEFGEMPVTTVMDVIMALSEKEDINSFFSGAFAMFNRTENINIST